ncbi:MAG: DUF2103 domain-containing protein [Natronomonas sp.]
MKCRHCATPLERPGDYCLVCRRANTDNVVLEVDRDRTTVSCLLDDELVAERTVTTTPVDDERWAPAELRNYAGRIADEIRRKRPDDVYAGGDRTVIGAIRADVHYQVYRVADDDPLGAVRNSHHESPLEVVEASIAEKLGGSHSTLIGGRSGRRILETVAAHPNVKKIVPGPIDAGGSGSRSGVRAKATRADENGNVRLLLRDGSSVQENRIVTTARDRDLGERLRSDLNDALEAAGYRT